MTDKVTHIAAKQSKQIFFAGVFRPITRGRRPKAPTFVNQLTPELTITLKSQEQMSTQEQDVLLALLAMATTALSLPDNDEEVLIGGVDSEGNTLPIPEEHEQHHHALIAGLPNEDAIAASSKSKVAVGKLPTIKIETTIYELAKEVLGRSKKLGGRQYDQITDALDMLAGTTIKYLLRGESEEGAGKRKRQGVASILSYYVNHETGKLIVSLNPISAHAIWSENGEYIRTDMEERRQLDTDLSRLLHDYLGGRVWAGEKGGNGLNLDNIIKSVYGSEPKSHATLKSRRVAFRAALALIDSTLPLWKVKVTGEGKQAKVRVERTRV